MSLRSARVGAPHAFRRTIGGLLRSLRHLAVGAVLLGLAAPVAAAPRADPIRLAITVDDLPWVGSAPSDGSVDEAVNRMAATFRVHGVPATGMVVCDTAAKYPGVVENWAAWGLTVGNHGRSHLDLHRSDTDAWLADVRDCHASLQRLGAAYLPVLRFPLLHQGLGDAQYDAAREGLRRAGIGLAPVSVDTSDWLLADAYGRSMRDAVRRRDLGLALVDHVRRAVRHADRHAARRFGRRPAQILLLHANALLDDHLDRLLLALRADGVEFIPLQEALRDPVYGLPDLYRGPKGLSALYRVDVDGAGAAYDDRAAAEITRRFAHAGDQPTPISTQPVGGDRGSPARAIAERAGGSARMRSLLVAHRGEVLLEAYFHGAGPELAANLKSVTKSLGSLLVGAAIAQGKLQDEHAVLPAGLQPVSADGQPPLDIRALLTMSTGFAPVDYGAIQQEGDWVARILASPRQPGWTGRFRYDTPVLQLLPATLEPVLGSSLEQSLRDLLPPPLRPGLAYWRRDGAGFVLGGNDAYLTPRALLAVGELVRSGGSLDGRQVVDRGYLRRSTSMQIDPVVEFANHDTLAVRGYGYLWWLLRIGGHDAIAALGHGGQVLLVFPSLDLVVVMTSRWAGPSSTAHYQHQAALLESAILPWIEDRAARLARRPAR